MAVLFLTAPSVPPAEVLPELARVQSGERPDLLVAHAGTAREWLAIQDRLEAFGVTLRQSERSSGDPLVAVWVEGPTENPEPLSLVADLIFLGGGWNLLREILPELDRSRGLDRQARLERLAGVASVYVPFLYQVDYLEEGTIARVTLPPGAGAPKGREGGAPFGSDRELLPPGHPRSEVQQLLGENHSPESLAGSIATGGPVRLHFFVGLPGEDGDGITEWVKRFRHACVHRLHNERDLPMISVSLACFVPRPWTPLQWWPMPTERALKDQISRVTRGLERIRGVTVTHDLPKWALLEGCLSRGDRRTGGLFLTIHRLGWERAVIQSPLNPAFILHRPRPAAEILPWDHLDWGIDRVGLRARYEALRSALGERA